MEDPQRPVPRRRRGAPAGTTVIIEDVAFPDRGSGRGDAGPAGAFDKHGYQEAIIFGHALDGNLHFVFAQDFASTPKWSATPPSWTMSASMVVEKYDGSLKAEHGTGRNMAPFVEMEWGRDATG